jgi:hypothetical protein
LLQVLHFATAFCSTLVGGVPSGLHGVGRKYLSLLDLRQKRRGLLALSPYIARV